MDGILVSEPVASLNGVIGVPSPVVLVHVSEGSIDASLGGDGVGPGREELGNAGGFEALFDEAEGGSQTGSSGANDHGIEGVIDNSVLLEKLVL